MHSAVPVANESRGENGTPDAGPAAGRAADAEACQSAFGTDGQSKALPNVEEEPHHAESGTRAFGQGNESHPGAVHFHWSARLAADGADAACAGVWDRQTGGSMDSAIGTAYEECWGHAEGSGDGPESHLHRRKRTRMNGAARKRQSDHAGIRTQWRHAAAHCAAAAAHCAATD